MDDRSMIDPAVETAAIEALVDVYDPELGLDVVSLGLIYDLYEEERRVVVEMTLTTPGCPVSEILPTQAERAIAAAVAPLGRSTEVRVVWDPPWTPERLSDEAAASLGFSRPGQRSGHRQR